MWQVIRFAPARVLIDFGRPDEPELAGGPWKSRTIALEVANECNWNTSSWCLGNRWLYVAVPVPMYGED